MLQAVSDTHQVEVNLTSDLQESIILPWVLITTLIEQKQLLCSACRIRGTKKFFTKSNSATFGGILDAFGGINFHATLAGGLQAELFQPYLLVYQQVCNVLTSRVGGLLNRDEPTQENTHTVSITMILLMHFNSLWGSCSKLDHQL